MFYKYDAAHEMRSDICFRDDDAWQRSTRGCCAHQTRRGFQKNRDPGISFPEEHQRFPKSLVKANAVSVWREKSVSSVRGVKRVSSVRSECMEWWDRPWGRGGGGQIAGLGAVVKGQTLRA